MTTATYPSISSIRSRYVGERVGYDARTGLTILLWGEQYEVIDTAPFGVRLGAVDGSTFEAMYETLWDAGATYC